MQNAVRADLFLQSLALSVARNAVGADLPIDQVLKSEGLTLNEYDDIRKNPTFQGYLANYTRELTDSGFSFEAKARVLAEDMLPGFYNMGRDPETPPAVRAKVMENLVKWGKLEPKESAGPGAGSGFSIVIDFGEGQKATVTASSPQPESNSQQEDVLDAEYVAVNEKVAIEHEIEEEPHGNLVAIPIPTSKREETTKLKGWLDEFLANDTSDDYEYDQ